MCESGKNSSQITRKDVKKFNRCSRLRFSTTIENVIMVASTILMTGIRVLWPAADVALRAIK